MNTIEDQYQLYLKLVNLKEKKMSHAQASEMRRCFYAACGQMMVLLRDKAEVMNQDEALEFFDLIMSEVHLFFVSEAQDIIDKSN